MLSSEINETNIGHIHSLSFVFAANEVLLDKLLW